MPALTSPARVRAAAVAWAAGILLLGAWFHPPDFSRLAQSLQLFLAVPDWATVPARLAATVGAVLAFLAVQAAALQPGQLTLAWIRRPGRGRVLVDGPVRVLTGWVVGGTAMFGLGGCGLVRWPVIALLTGLSIVGARRRIAAGGAALREVRGMWRKAGRPGRVAGVVGAIAAVLTGVAALAPESQIDSLIYHLPVADRALALGSLAPMPGKMNFHLASLGEMLRTWAMALGGESAGRLFGPMANLLSAALLLASLAPVAGADWAFAAGTVWLTNPDVVALTLSSKPEPLLAALALAGVILAGRSRGRAAVAGLALGGAAAMKLLAASFAAVVGSVVVRAAVQARSRARHLPVPRLVFGMAVALPLLPWLARSWLLTGNPVYPGGFHVFGGLGLSSAMERNILNDMATATHDHAFRSFGERLSAWWVMTMTEASVSPSWLALLPLALLVGVPGSAGNRVRFAAAVAIAAWLAGPIQFRYLMPVLPVLVVLGIEGLATGTMSRRRPARGMRLPGGLLVALALLTQAAAFLAGPVPLALAAGSGLESRTAYLHRVLPEWTATVEAIGTISAGSRVACAGTDFAYPATRALVAPSRFEPPAFVRAVRSSTTVSQLRIRLRQAGLTHVLYNPVGAVYLRWFQAPYAWSARDAALWARYWSADAREVFRSPPAGTRRGFFVLYALDARGPATKAPAYLPGIEGALIPVEFDVLAGHPAAARTRLAALAPALGRFGSYLHFAARVDRGEHPRRALALMQAAERAGDVDPALFEDLADVADRLGEAAVAASARSRLVGPPPP